MEVLLWKCAVKFLADNSPAVQMGPQNLTLSTGSATSGESDESCFDSVYVVWHQMAEKSRTCLRPHFQMRRDTSRSENNPLAEQAAQSELPVAST